MKKLLIICLIFSLIDMSVVTWDMLAKNQTDPETVEEAAARLIAAHVADETAHLAVGESLSEHKTDAVVDHPAESVVNDKIQYSARAYSAIVSAVGGDFADIQDAIDYVHGVGGGKILICNGTYELAASLVLYSNIIIEGESELGVILKFSTADTGLQAIGDAAPYSTGTVSASHDSDQVVGVGTNWDPEIVAGQYISLDYRWFEVKSVEDDTHLTLTRKYYGPTLAGVTYEAATFITDVMVSDLSIEGDGVNSKSLFQYVARGTFQNIHGVGTYKVGLHLNRTSGCEILNSDNVGYYVCYSNLWHIENNEFVHYYTNAMFYNRDGVFSNNSANFTSGNAIDMEYSKRISIINNSLRNTDYSTIYLNYSEDNVIIGNLIYGGTYGIRLDISPRNKIAENSISNSSYSGIAILASSNYSIIHGNTTFNCTGGAGNGGIMLRTSNYLVVTSNVSVGNTTHGIYVDHDVSYSVLNGNICYNNGAYGIYIYNNTCTKNIMTSNQLLGNTSGAYVNNGTSTTIANNITA
jgi:parallel beta-helix repeat protein